jgi:hypothetical protein
VESTIYTIDRFENDHAVLLLRGNETIRVDVSRSELPDDVTEGTILDAAINENGKVLSARILEHKTEETRQKAQNLLEKILGKNK